MHSGIAFQNAPLPRKIRTAGSQQQLSDQLHASSFFRWRTPQSMVSMFHLGWLGGTIFNRSVSTVGAVVTDIRRYLGILTFTERMKEQWRKEQVTLKEKLLEQDTEEWQQTSDDTTPFRGLKYVAGLDLSYAKDDPEKACASLVVMSYPDLEVVYSDCTPVQVTAPYVPGFLCAREVGFHVQMVDRLQQSASEYMPQVILVDGNGKLHPSGFGIACHLGVLTDLPTIGVAKNPFTGFDGMTKEKHKNVSAEQLKKGGDSFLVVGTSGKVYGRALLSKDGITSPVYVSVGHRVTLDTAVKLVYACCQYRVPEPIRQADLRSREYIRLHFGSDSTT
ncbi:endonuclease V-like [Branchiostoma floridae x Branchiostoma belcheri]